MGFDKVTYFRIQRLAVCKHHGTTTVDNAGIIASGGHACMQNGGVVCCASSAMQAKADRDLAPSVMMSAVSFFDDVGLHMQ